LVKILFLFYTSKIKEKISIPEWDRITSIFSGPPPMGNVNRIKPLLSRHLTPARIFLLSFIIIILGGTVLLWQSFSAAKGSLTFIDALFTSTSAVCVTGLVVIDLGQDLSLTGQVITLFLFQVGGLGIITFSTIFFVLMGRGISFKGREIAQSTFLHTPRQDFFLILKSVLWSTFIFESLGTLLLWFRFAKDFPPGQAFYQALYHAVSAFNNCGYSLLGKNLMPYQGDWLVNLTVMGLIVIGGIGFIVQYEILSRLGGKLIKLSVHSKMVLYTTSVLIFLGAFLFYIAEEKNVLGKLPLSNQILTSLFQSITPRTCGFNTVDIGALTNTTLLLLLVLMFIGGSPGSTAGGIKTTSAALLTFLIWNRFRGNETVNLFRRTIPQEIVSRTISIIFASGFLIFLISSILLLTAESNAPPLESRNIFVDYVFETVSAFGTVGLSMGITPTLNGVQKAAIIFMMFIGRVGPLTLAFSLSRRTMKEGITYAEEGVMVG
jgi:trk system potassium uptake protein TrkH